jgi:UDP-N-acetylglucosamine 4,6-dehydratase
MSPIDSIHHKRVLVTGGTGWLGTRLVRALVQARVEVRIYARARGGSQRRSNLDGVSAEVEVRHGDITDRDTLADALKGIGVVFHLAAEKAVDLCEREPLLAIQTNLFGAVLLSELASSAGITRIVAASSDKASSPESVLGTTKLLMERILTNPGTAPPSAAVRLGSLLQSGGSVLERWRRTTPDGYIEVTDPDMTRFAMTGDEAVDLLMRAASRPGREIIAKALPAYRLGDLADLFAAKNRVRVLVVGRRTGEKKHESLVSEAEAPFARRDGDLLVITPLDRQDGTEPYTSRIAPRIEAAVLEASIPMERPHA